jgi:beta-xylosidase
MILVRGSPANPETDEPESMIPIDCRPQGRWGFLSALAGVVVLTAACGTAALADSSRLPAAALKHWTADNGNGTYSNPLFYGEFEDPDMIRVGDDYCLVGTTMHMNPALEILHSKDLVNWELAGYCMDRLDFGPAFRLEGGDIYGRGIWAPCIRHHRDTFYIFSNVNGVGLQVFRSKSIKGPWERNQLPGRHDLSVLFDDELHKIFIISGAGNRGPEGSTTYPIEELTPDLRAFDTQAPKRQMVIPRGTRMGEGHHLYKINGKYYDLSAIPGGPVDQMVARADSIDGPWQVTYMVQSESMGVTGTAPARAQAQDRGLWIHQGGMCDTPSGEWWCAIMSDHGSAGRMVSLVPVTWAEGFPLIGLPGNLRKAPNTWIKPDTGFTQPPKPTYVWNENFNRGKLHPQWQWNHVPDDTKWSLTEKPGVLRLHSLPAADFYHARNTVCQRPPGPECIVTVELDTTGLRVGDTAGLALLSSPYAWIGVVKSTEGMTLQMLTGGGRRRGPGPASPSTNAPTLSPIPPPNRLWLRVHCNFDTDEAVLGWSADGRQFTPLGKPFTMTFQLTTFQGVRPGLFHFNTSGQPGGYADFDNYVCEEPRARGSEREIPLGKTIALTSGADGSLLACDTQNHTLVNVPAESGGISQRAKFQVVDLGQGRVALTTVTGRFVSADGEAVVLKDLAGKAPGNAESFQWVNLMFGDTMLMALTNHRYLATDPNAPGPVTATATGPTPARKGGECFKWKVVE